MSRTHPTRFVLPVVLFGLLVAAPVRATAPPLRGSLPPQVRTAMRAGVVTAPGVLPSDVHSSQTQWLVPVILVTFPDSTLRYSAAQLQTALFDTSHATPDGSVVDYLDWVSRGRLRFRAEIVATVTMPFPENYYAADAYGMDYFGTPHNDWGLVRDAVQGADPTVDWNRFDLDSDGYVDMLWILHAGLGGEGTGSGRNIWSITSAMSSSWARGGVLETNDFIPNSTTRHVRVDRFSTLPELSMFHPGARSEIGVFCHEFGHAIGLPDLYDTSVRGGGGNMGPGDWSLMSTGAYGGSGHDPESPSHVGGWCMMYLGWADYLRPTADTLVTIAPLSSGGPVYNFWFQGEPSPEHYLIESRRRESFDRFLPDDGLLLYQIDDGLMGLRLPGNTVNVGFLPALRLVEGDGHSDLVLGYNFGDAGDPLPGSSGRVTLDDDTSPSLRTIAGAPTNLGIDSIEVVAGGTRARLRVRARDWHPIQDLTVPGYVAATGASRGHHAVIDAAGFEREVYGDARSGIAQVVLRTRRVASDTAQVEVVSASSRGAFDPVIALLPGDDLAIAWVDRRETVPQVYFRARIGGVWTAERALTHGTAVCGTPAIAADAHGRVYVTWIETSVVNTVMKLLVFTWSNPFGTPLTLTQPGDLPASPSIAAAPDGQALVVWPDRGTGNYVLQFAHYSPDSGLGPRLRLTPNNSYPQPSSDVTADGNGSFHVTWQQVTSGLSEIHYQRRPPGGIVVAIDTVVVWSVDAMQNPCIAVDAGGNIHIALERTTLVGQEVRYTRWTPVHGWDAIATQVSNAADGSAQRIAVLPVSREVATVLYSDDNGSTRRLKARNRTPLGGTGTLGVPPALPRPLALRLGPNPLHAGEELRLSGSTLDGAASVELLDVGGRRVAGTAVAGGVARFGPATTAALAPGLYFARTRIASARVVVVR